MWEIVLVIAYGSHPILAHFLLLTMEKLKVSLDNSTVDSEITVKK